jgi:hypothetical protein
MSKQRVYLHVLKHWSGEPTEVWKKFFAWLGERPNFEGTINVFQFNDYLEDGKKPGLCISIESEPKEVT